MCNNFRKFDSRKSLGVIGAFFVTVRASAAYWHFFHAVGKFCENQLRHAALVLITYAYGHLFTARRSCASAVLGVVVLSVHPSVCLSVTRVL